MKAKTYYICSNCGNRQAKWMGKCPECNAWNTLEEQIEQPTSSKSKAGSSSSSVPSISVNKLSEINWGEEYRYTTGIGELNRVLGGGIVLGSVILLSGDPGIGKSTLLLQICETLCKSGDVLYVSGEESARQIKLRANRLGVTADNLHIGAATDIESIIETIHQMKPSVVMIDSIQTMNLTSLSSSSGSIAQVRECTQMLILTAKSLEIPIFIVGHVNKEGSIAGPKVMEHMVDVVLYFEGERNLAYKILRAIKNRYGSTNEIGVFEMGDNGLDEVPNPSQALLAGRPENVSGTCVACVMVGSRPILAEFQALVSKTSFNMPKRVSTGFDFNRAALLIAVLEKRCGFYMGNMDAYINVVGGLRLDEPSADLPVVLALVSNLLDKPIDDDIVAFGEVGLAGELRSVSHVQTRINEAQRLGFTRCVLPKQCLTGIKPTTSMELIGVKNLYDAIKLIK
ncbi:MAG: DNA repair protein RadA [Oscillospiraceae bacterium]